MTKPTSGRSTPTACDISLSVAGKSFHNSAKALFHFLLPMIDPVYFGIDHRPPGRPRICGPVNLKDVVVHVANGTAFERYVHPVKYPNMISLKTKKQCEPRVSYPNIPKKITLKRFRDHLKKRSESDGTKRFLFTPNGNPGQSKILIDLDIDAKHTQDSVNAQEQGRMFLTDYIASRPSLGSLRPFIEGSDGGFGTHAYFLLEKTERGISPKGQGAPRYSSAIVVNEALEILEDDLRKFFQLKQSLDEYDQISGIEVNGKCTIFSPDEYGFRRVEKCGKFGRLPVTAHERQEEFAGISTVSEASIRLLGETHWKPINRPVARKHEPKSDLRIAVGSVARHPLSPDNIAMIQTDYLQKALEIMPSSLATSGRQRVLHSDMAIFLAILDCLSRDQLPSGAMPSNRIKAVWNSLARSGEVGRSYDNKRVAAMRNHLSDNGYIEWTDHHYWNKDNAVRSGNPTQTGRSCRYRLTPNIWGLKMDRTDADSPIRENTTGTTLDIPLIRPVWAGSVGARQRGTA